VYVVLLLFAAAGTYASYISSMIPNSPAQHKQQGPVCALIQQNVWFVMLPQQVALHSLSLSRQQQGGTVGAGGQ